MRHGTSVNYATGGCRCEECRRAHRESDHARNRRTMCGTSLFVPADPVRERVRALIAYGMSQDEIARAAGLDDSRLDNLMGCHWRTGRPITRMKRENAARVMAVKARKPLLHTVVDIPESRDLVLDLMAMGYSAMWIARSLGMSYQGRGKLLKTTHHMITHAKLRRLYRQTRHPAPTSPVASRSRNFALAYRAKRWGRVA